MDVSALLIRPDGADGLGLSGEVQCFGDPVGGGEFDAELTGFEDFELAGPLVVGDELIALAHKGRDRVDEGRGFRV